MTLASCLAAGGIWLFLSLLLFAERFRGVTLVGAGFVGALGLL
jgi:hypothetical protein